MTDVNKENLADVGKHHQSTLTKKNLADIDQKIAQANIGKKNLVNVDQKTLSIDVGPKIVLTDVGQKLDSIEVT